MPILSRLIENIRSFNLDSLLLIALFSILGSPAMACSPEASGAEMITKGLLINQVDGFYGVSLTRFDISVLDCRALPCKGYTQSTAAGQPQYFELTKESHMVSEGLKKYLGGHCVQNCEPYIRNLSCSHVHGMDYEKNEWFCTTKHGDDDPN